SNYIALIEGIVARRSKGEAASRAIFAEALQKCDVKRWPYPITQHLNGDLTERNLLASATDLEQITETHCYIGLHFSAQGDTQKALSHLRWVNENGQRD